MQAATVHFEEVRGQRLVVQDQLVKVRNKINEIVVRQKRIKAEIEEVGTKNYMASEFVI